MNNTDKELLKTISDWDGVSDGAYNIRYNGKGIERKVTENVNIVTKTDVPGIDINVKENAKRESVHIPVLLTESGLKDDVYNDFFIGKNADVVIVAGCGIHNDEHADSEHNGIHRFFLEENAKVKYIEKHYGEGNGDGKRILNPVTEVTLKNGAYMEITSVQIKGVDSTERVTKADVGDNATLVINEKIMTHGVQTAKTVFELNLNGDSSKAQISSRTVATENSKQTFVSRVYGNAKCFSHVECDSIIKDRATVTSIPEITANNVDANLIHEAAIGKINGEQLTKLMTLGLNEKEAENAIIEGFLK